MGAEPFFIRKPFINSPDKVLKRFYNEILNSIPDWPEVRINGAGGYFTLSAINNKLQELQKNLVEEVVFG